MVVRISRDRVAEDLLARVQEISGQNLYACYQCGKCAAGCPVVTEMDVLPSQIIRLLQLGQGEVVFASKTMWLCASCLTCSARCPKGVDVAKVMDALRAIRQRSGIEVVQVSRLPARLVEDLPQQALISRFRKLTPY